MVVSGHAIRVGIILQRMQSCLGGGARTGKSDELPVVVAIRMRIDEAPIPRRC